MLNDFEHQDTFTLLYIHILLFDRLARPFALHHIRQAEAHTHERGHDSPPRSEKIEHSSLCGASGSSSCGSIPYAFYSYGGGGIWRDASRLRLLPRVSIRSAVRQGWTAKQGVASAACSTCVTKPGGSRPSPQLERY